MENYNTDKILTIIVDLKFINQTQKNMDVQGNLIYQIFNATSKNGIKGLHLL